MPKKTTPPDTKPEILIDLDALAEPSGFLKIGKARHPYKRWDLFSILEQKQIAKQWGRIAAIEEAEDITEEESNEYSTLARTVLKTICDIPDATLDKLNTTQQVDACIGFFGTQRDRQMTRPILLMKMLGRGLPILARSSSASTPTSSEGSSIG